MAYILSLAHVGSGSTSFELYALVQQDKACIDHRSPCKDYVSWNAFPELELISHPDVAAEVYGSSLRQLQHEVKALKQRAPGGGEAPAATCIADVVKKSISIFQDLKKKNSPSDMFMWDLLARKHGCIELFMDILTSLQPGSSLHREILYTICNCVRCKHGRNLLLENDANITAIVNLLQGKALATIKVALYILASLLRAKHAYVSIKGSVKETCKKMNVPQWSILVSLLGEEDVDARYTVMSLIIALGRSSAFAAPDKLAAKAASTKFYMKMELAGLMKGLALLAASQNPDELKLVDQYTMLCAATPVPRSWRDCEVLKQQLSVVEERCLGLEEQVCGLKNLSSSIEFDLFFQLFESQSVRKIASRMQEELDRLHSSLLKATRGDGSWDLKRTSRFSRYCSVVVRCALFS